MRQHNKPSPGRILKFCISLIVFAWISFSRSVSQLLAIRRPPRSIVLYYHSIPHEFRGRFAQQLDTILRRARPVHPEQTDSLEMGGRYCLVTFDDGFLNFMEVALPELAKRQIPSLMFVITEALGKSFGPSDAPEKIMTVEQLEGLPASLVAIGSHSLTHPYLPDLNEQEAWKELIQSRLTLEELLNKPVPYFSFPFGGMSPNLVSLCRQAGYSRIYSTLPASTSFAASEFCVGRVRVDPWDWPMEFRMKLAGAYNWLPAAIALKKWLLGNSDISSARKGATGASRTIRQSFIQG